MKSQIKTAEKLEFKWDKRQQVFCEKKKLTKTDKNTQRDVNEYLKFLSEIKVGGVLPEKNRLADKQFTL